MHARPQRAEAAPVPPTPKPQRPGPSRVYEAITAARAMFSISLCLIDLVPPMVVAASLLLSVILIWSY
jgi:hypothetical protein